MHDDNGNRFLGAYINSDALQSLAKGHQRQHHPSCLWGTLYVSFYSRKSSLVDAIARPGSFLSWLKVRSQELGRLREGILTLSYRRLALSIRSTQILDLITITASRLS